MFIRFWHRIATKSGGHPSDSLRQLAKDFYSELLNQLLTELRLEEFYRQKFPAIPTKLKTQYLDSALKTGEANE